MTDIHMAAGLLMYLREECENQKARADAAEKNEQYYMAECKRLELANDRLKVEKQEYGERNAKLNKEVAKLQARLAKLTKGL